MEAGQHKGCPIKEQDCPSREQDFGVSMGYLYQSAGLVTLYQIEFENPSCKNKKFLYRIYKFLCKLYSLQKILALEIPGISEFQAKGCLTYQFHYLKRFETDYRLMPDARQSWTNF